MLGMIGRRHKLWWSGKDGVGGVSYGEGGAV